MEKSHTDFLQECQAELDALKARIAALEEKLSSYEAESQAPEAAEEAVDFTDVQIGVREIPVQKEPAPVVPDVPKPKEEAVRYPWHTDKPGMSVKNIRSGISLLDRALFIGTLFKEDFALYDSTVAAMNEMTSLDQAVAYIREHFPQWDLGSEVVYRFMMAVRKKLG